MKITVVNGCVVEFEWESEKVLEDFVYNPKLNAPTLPVKDEYCKEYKECKESKECKERIHTRSTAHTYKKHGAYIQGARNPKNLDDTRVACTSNVKDCSSNGGWVILDNLEEIYRDIEKAYPNGNKEEIEVLKSLVVGILSNADLYESYTDLAFDLQVRTPNSTTKVLKSRKTPHNQLHGFRFKDTFLVKNKIIKNYYCYHKTGNPYHMTGNPSSDLKIRELELSGYLQCAGNLEKQINNSHRYDFRFPGINGNLVQKKIGVYSSCIIGKKLFDLICRYEEELRPTNGE